MHSGRDQHYRFVEFEGSFELWKDEIVEKFLICIILVFMVMGGNREQMNIPALWTFDQDLFVKVEIVNVQVIVKVVNIVEVGLVGVGVAEGKVDLFLFTFK